MLRIKLSLFFANIFVITLISATYSNPLVAEKTNTLNNRQSPFNIPTNCYREFYKICDAKKYGNAPHDCFTHNKVLEKFSAECRSRWISYLKARQTQQAKLNMTNPSDDHEQLPTHPSKDKTENIYTAINQSAGKKFKETKIKIDNSIGVTSPTGLLIILGCTAVFGGILYSAMNRRKQIPKEENP